jgi:hypothetical protein
MLFPAGVVARTGDQAAPNSVMMEAVFAVPLWRMSQPVF